MGDSDDSGERIVEAIENGKIVSVSESYARRESLPILKRPQINRNSEEHKNVGKVPTSMMMRGKEHPMEYLKKPHTWQEKQVLSELVENFHWVIRSERRRKGITRKQLSKLSGESEESIQKLEFGILPSPDFVLINKIQQALGVNLRKDGRDFNKPVAGNFVQKKENSDDKFKHLSSDREIEILDDDL